MNPTIKFAKVHPDAVIPSKRKEDMGYDIYACFDEDYIIIPPHETKMIPTGIASACDEGYGFLLWERGSTGSKGIALRCGVLDSGFRGAWFVCWTNTNDKPVVISKVSEEEFCKTCQKIYEPVEHLMYPYDKAIAQAIVTRVYDTVVDEVSYDALKEITSERGNGQLGSSKK